MRSRSADFLGAMLLLPSVMIMAMENAALNAIKPFLGAGESAVGTRVDVFHLAATPVGRKVVAGAQVTKVDGRRIEFKIEATDGVAPIGIGTHERMVIDMVRFLEPLKQNSAYARVPACAIGESGRREGAPSAAFFGYPPLKSGLKPPSKAKEYSLLQRRLQL